MLPRRTQRPIECMAVTEQTPVPAVAAPAAPPREIMYRHSVVVRVTHWINALCLVLLLMSGLRIFNYHPSLYWGNYGYRGVPSFLSIGASEDSETNELTGFTRIGDWRFVTTGVLGVSADADGDPAAMAFPNWITLPGGPGLALARDWHFALAWLLVLNGTVYLLFGLLSGHFRRDIAPAAEELASAPRAARDLGPHPAAPAAGRRRAALQRAAKTRLRRRDLRAAAGWCWRPASPCRRR